MTCKMVSLYSFQHTAFHHSFSTCLVFLLSASDPLHFCSQHLSFVFSVTEQNCLLFTLICKSLNSLAGQHWSSGHNPCPWLGMLAIMRVKPFSTDSPLPGPFPCAFHFCPEYLFQLFSSEHVFGSHCSHTPLTCTKEGCLV